MNRWSSVGPAGGHPRSRSSRTRLLACAPADKPAEQTGAGNGPGYIRLRCKLALTPARLADAAAGNPSDRSPVFRMTFRHAPFLRSTPSAEASRFPDDPASKSRQSATSRSLSVSCLIQDRQVVRLVRSGRYPNVLLSPIRRDNSPETTRAISGLHRGCTLFAPGLHNPLSHCTGNAAELHKGFMADMP